MEKELLNRNFTYQPVKDGQPERYKQIRDKAKELATLIDDLCPDSREKSLGITQL